MHPDLEAPAHLVRRLRELPESAAGPYDWAEFRRRAARRAQPPAGGAGRTLAAAAVLALGLLALASRLGDFTPPPGGPPLALGPEVATPDSQPPGPAPVAHTAAMERWLASLPSEPAVVRVGTRAAVIGLEDRIAQVDDLLSAERFAPAQQLALQHERARLMGTLVQVRYAETLADESR